MVLVPARVITKLLKYLGVLVFIGSFFSFEQQVQAQASATAIKGLYKFRVENPNCSLRVKEGGSWEVYRGPKLKKGSLAIGRPSVKSPDLVVFKTRAAPRSILAGRKSCVFESGGGEELNVGEKFKIQATFTILSWQESLKLKLKGSVGSTTLRATNLSACPGATLLRAKSTYDYGVGACMLFGKSQAGRSSAKNQGTGDISDYAVKNVSVFGLGLFPKILWRPESGSVAFGGTVPVMFRYGNWPVEAGSSASIGPKFWFLIGLALEARLERGAYYFGQKVGILFNNPKSLNWALEGGYTF